MAITTLTPLGVPGRTYSFTEEATPAFRTLYDNFNDNTLDAALWEVGDVEGFDDALVTVSETSQQLHITPRSSFGGVAYRGIKSVNVYDLTGSEAFVNVAQPTNSVGGAETHFIVYLDAANFVNIAKSGGTMYFQKRVAGSTTTLTTAAYNGSTDLWWRIREASGTIYYDTSADGGSWTNRTSTTVSWDYSALKVALLAGTWDSVATPGTAIFEDFNGGAAAATTYTVDNTDLFFSPGNWVKSGSTYAQTNNPGASIKGAFTGTGVAIDFDGSMYINANRPYVAYRIDGGSWSSAQLSTSNPQTVTLASGLSNASHTFELALMAVRPENGRWSSPEAMIRVLDVTVAGTLSTPTLATERWIVFGDSISEGTNVLADTYTIAAQDATEVWGRQIGADVDAEMGIVGFISQGWTTTGIGSVPIFHDPSTPYSWALHYSGQSRSFTGIDAIVVNIGANDALNSASTATVEANVSDFLTEFRAANAGVRVYMVMPFGGFSTYRAAIQAGIDDAAIDNCYVIATSDAGLEADLDDTGGTTTTYSHDDIHPNQAGHDYIATLLAGEFDGEQTITATRIESAATVYAPIVTTGSVTVSPSLIASVATVYAPTVTPGAVTVSVTRLESTAEVFAPTVTQGAVAVSPTRIESTAVVYAPAITTGAVTVTLERIESGATVYQPTVTSGLTIVATRIESTAQVYAPSVTVGSVTVSPARVESTVVVYAPTITTTVTVTVARVESSAQVFAPAVTQGGVTVAPQRIESTAQVYQPVVTTGAVTISPTRIESGATVYQPVVSHVTTQTITLTRIGSTSIVYQVIVSLFTISAERTYTVPADDRTFVVVADDRIYAI